jgi:hypothetical protein
MVSAMEGRRLANFIMASLLLFQTEAVVAFEFFSGRRLT